MYRIKEIMSQKGITSKQLADRLGITPQYASNILREKDNVSVKTLCRIAEVLEVPVSSLFEDYVAPSEECLSVRCPHCRGILQIRISKG